MLGTVLREQDYQINVAQNGVQALEMVEKVAPDLILLDVMMPEMDGFEACKRLKADEKDEGKYRSSSSLRKSRPTMSCMDSRSAPSDYVHQAF